MKAQQKYLHKAAVYFLLFFLSTLNLLKLNAQNYPQNYFRYPLDSLPNLVSPFGGLRDNHFHSGIDLRTNGREGLPVYAAADGYISRIKIQRNGYGKAVYIEHANGYSTVYGHLQKYNGPLANWIHQYQYINKTFEFDKIFIKPFLFVKKGEIIGYSGNSGGSTGPHLHYEIRDIRTEKILNPALFGLIPKDTIAPVILKLFVYKFVTEGLLLKNEIAVSAKSCYKTDSMWVLKDMLLLSPETYGFGLETYDYIHNAWDEKGIYEISYYNNSALKFKHCLNQFAFDESKYINAHIDYPYYRIQKTRVQKCFVDDGNMFSTYTTDAQKGRFNASLQDNHMGEVIFVVKDFNQNAFTIKANYRIIPSALDQEKLAYDAKNLNKPMLIPGKAQQINAEGIKIKLDPKSLYDTVFYKLEINAPQKEMLSNEFEFHTPNTPVHAAFDIAIQAAHIPLFLHSKLLLGYSNGKSDNIRSAGGNYENGWVKGKGASFGNYSIVLDTIAPSIKWMDYKNEYDANDTLRWDFEMKDNFSGISSYKGFLNGNWILLDYDPKNQQITYRFDEVYQAVLAKYAADQTEGMLKSMDLLIILEDQKGNVREKHFEIPVW